jgi:hypothetical protein
MNILFLHPIRNPIAVEKLSKIVEKHATAPIDAACAEILYSKNLFIRVDARLWLGRFGQNLDSHICDGSTVPKSDCCGA